CAARSADVQLVRGLNTTTLGRAAAVMRDGGHVRDIADLQAAGVESPDGGLAAGAGAIDAHIDVLEAVQLDCSAAGFFSSGLRGKRRALPGAAETRATGCGPGQGITLTISDRHDGVVERSVDMGHAVRH